MQQENGGLPEVQPREENLRKLLTKVEKLGWSEMKPQIIEAFERGLAEFQAFGEKRFGNSRMEVSFHFGGGKKDDGNIYLNEMEALLTRPVLVPHKTIDGWDTEQIEFMILHLPKDENGKINISEMSDMDMAHVTKVQEQMQRAMKEAPDVFNALIILYNPPLAIQVPQSMKEQQERLQQSTVVYNKVSSYFNLTALELYNAMDDRFPLKTLFKTKDTALGNAMPDDKKVTKNLAGKPHHTQTDPASEATKNKRQFRAYVKMNFEARLPDGTSPIELIPENRLKIGRAMLEFNVEEMQSRHNRGEILRYLEKGSLVEFTNLNKTGERSFLLSTNPEYGTMNVYRTNRTIIYDTKPYLKNPLTVEVGAVVTIHKETGQSATAPLALEPQQVSQIADRFQKGKQQALTDQNPTVSNSASPVQSPASNETNQKNEQNQRLPADDMKDKGQSDLSKQQSADRKDVNNNVGAGVGSEKVSKDSILGAKNDPQTALHDGSTVQSERANGIRRIKNQRTIADSDTGAKQRR